MQSRMWFIILNFTRKIIFCKDLYFTFLYLYSIIHKLMLFYKEREIWKTMIEVSNLCKKYGANVAVENVSFTVNKGEILGFLGPNGAGKSTTMNIMTGYISATSGNVSIAGNNILEEPINAKKHIGYLPEHPPLYLNMTVKEYLDFIYDLKKAAQPRRAHIADICKIVKIDHVYKRLIKNLSKGYKQRVGIAQALIGNPDVLILDEPTVGLDPMQIVEIRTLIKALGEKHTVILSSHILSEVQAVCDRIIVIHKGKIVADDTAGNLSHTLSDDRRYIIRVEGPEKDVYKMLSNMPDVKEVHTLGEREKGIFEYSVDGQDGADVRRELFKRLTDRNWPLMELRSSEMTLEDIFMKLTQVEEKASKKGGKK